MAEWFDLIEGLSPWWWVALGLGLGAVEMLTMSFFLFWPGLAAIAIAALIGLFPLMPGEIRVALSAALAVALTVAGRASMHRFGAGGGAVTNRNARSAQLIGRRATVLDWNGGEGAVEIDGIRWQARWDGDQVSATGRSVEITGADGITLLVRNRHPGT